MVWLTHVHLHASDGYKQAALFARQFIGLEK